LSFELSSHASVAGPNGSNSDEEVVVQVFGVGPADTTPAGPKQPFWVKLGP